MQGFEPQKLCGLSLFGINSIWMFTMLRAAEFERHKLCATPLVRNNFSILLRGR